MLISIITATFNSEATIANAVASVKAQTHKEIQHVIVDGNSKDETLDIIRQNRLKNTILISESDNGIFDALNKGINASDGDYLGFLHSDDVYANANVLQDVHEQLIMHDADILYGDLEYVKLGDEPKVVRYWKSCDFDIRKLKYGWMPAHPTFFMKSELYRNLGGFDESYRIASDYDAMLRYLKTDTLRTHYFPKTLVKMAVGGNSNQFSNILPKMKEDFNILKRHGYNPYLGLLLKNSRKLGQFI